MIKQRLKDLIETDTSLLEVFTGLVAFLLGLVVLNPLTDTIQSGTSSAGVLSEFGWGFFLATVGAWQLFATIFQQNDSLRKVAAMISAFLWGFILVISLSESFGIAFALYAPFLAGNMLALWQANRRE